MTVFDARTEAEFRGEDLRGNARGGHLPGARLLPHGGLLDAGRLRPAAALREMIADAGFRAGEALVTHCQGGGRAALAALTALRTGPDVQGAPATRRARLPGRAPWRRWPADPQASVRSKSPSS